MADLAPLPRKVLVANRGEIAVRIFRTCRAMQIGTVAVCSSADARALHVRMADEAWHIGPAPALESYLNQDRVIEAARDSGADAIHPGYGFLAENAEFARRVIDEGLLWIGPPVVAIASMGDKAGAKALARSQGVPVVPGYDGEDQSLERLTAEAEGIGYPVMLKATAGGGGKGMRTVHVPEDLAAALEGARREARSAFGDDRVFLEKLLERPRHVEMQIVGDTHGGMVYLGDRDCSLQRRHQKIIEETPSPALMPELRTSMGEAATRLARAAGYINAGTVEFLLTGEAFYFLEMNTRLQVEHPVTEAVTGLDLVALQLEIAAGRPLPFDQEGVNPHGSAIEVRLYAEDPDHDFLPVTGHIQRFLPPEGPGIRNDAGVTSGSEIGPYYDPLLAKLITSGESRAEALERMQSALQQYTIQGLTTNLPFLRWLAGHSEFSDGRADITFVDRTWHAEPESEVPDAVLVAVAAFEMSPPATGEAAALDSPWTALGGWRQRGLGRTFRFRTGSKDVEVAMTRRGAGTLQAALNGETREAETLSGSPWSLRIGHEVVTPAIERTPDGWLVRNNGVEYHVAEARREERTARGGQEAATEEAVSPMPGTVVKVLVEAGDHVSARQPLLVLEAMKMEHVVEAPHQGVVRAVLRQPGEPVRAGEALVELGRE